MPQVIQSRPNKTCDEGTLVLTMGPGGRTLVTGLPQSEEKTDENANIRFFKSCETMGGGGGLKNIRFLENMLRNKTGSQRGRG